VPQADERDGKEEQAFMADTWGYDVGRQDALTKQWGQRGQRGGLPFLNIYHGEIRRAAKGRGE
jgi:hypothetical protein